MPTLVEVAAFVANRDALTEQFCVNIDAPTLDCRAACYLGSQVSQIGEKLSKDEPNQLSNNTAPTSGPTYVLPKGLELYAPFSATFTRTSAVTRNKVWTARYLDVASPPPLV